MKKFINIILPISFVFMTILSQGQDIEDHEITIEELKTYLEFLASDSLKGRKPGTPEGTIAAEFIRDQFKNSGLELLGEEGMQYYDIVTDVELGEDNSMIINRYVCRLGEEFTPLAFSSNDTVEAEMVFVGYGFDISSDSLQWNDYKDIDVKGKWVMVLRGSPESEKFEAEFEQHTGLRDKVLTARDKGAIGVLFVSGLAFDEEDKLIELSYDKAQANAGMPVMHITRNTADLILKNDSYTIAGLEDAFARKAVPNSFKTNAQIWARTNIQNTTVRDQNVVGLVEGNDPLLKNEYIVIGAHYDHLGMGGWGSGSRMPDTSAAHNGADDNGSGTVGIIEIAEKLAANKDNLQRSIVVIAFGAEEMGLLGSAYFVKNPLVDINKIIAMINFDMIGRLDEEKRSISISGTGTSVEGEEILNALSQHYNLKPAFSPGGYGPSDHAAFYGADIPVFFISTGAHGDYHTPFDDVEFINFEGQKDIADFSYDLVFELANRDHALTFQEAGPKKRTGGRMSLKVTLGIMPDFQSQDNNGLGVGGVTKGRPADNAGLLKGDIITAIDGMTITNIYDYMNRLKKLEPGQIITVDIMRGGEKMVMIVQLEE